MQTPHKGRHRYHDHQQDEEHVEEKLLPMSHALWWGSGGGGLRSDRVVPASACSLTERFGERGAKFAGPTACVSAMAWSLACVCVLDW